MGFFAQAARLAIWIGFLLLVGLVAAIAAVVSSHLARMPSRKDGWAFGVGMAQAAAGWLVAVVFERWLRSNLWIGLLVLVCVVLGVGAGAVWAFFRPISRAYARMLGWLALTDCLAGFPLAFLLWFLVNRLLTWIL